MRWLAAPTRYAGLTPTRARAALAALALLVALCMAATLTAPAPPAASRPGSAAAAADRADVHLYENVVARVRRGEPYYPAAAAALRTGGYPLKPFVTFRLPTLAWVEARAPRSVVIAAAYLLAAGTFAAWTARLAAAVPRTPPRLIAAALVLAGMVRFVQPELVVFHEVWASLLVALALALRRPGRWRASVALALAAVLIRETAALFAVVMAGAAAIERERGEAIAWTGVLLALAAALAVHAQAVAGVVLPGDPASPGWAGMHGPGLFVLAVVAATALSLLPALAAAALAALAAFGWSGWRDGMGVRVLGVLAAYGVLIAAAARPDTWYWALFAAIPLTPGLLFAPDALGDLVAAARGRRETA